MRTGSFALVIAIGLGSACTAIEGLSPVPTPVEGGASDASADKRENRPDGAVDARADGSPTIDAPVDAGPPSPTPIATAQDNPISIHVSPPTAYWVDNVPDGSVMSVAISGGAEPVVLSGAQVSPFSLVLDPPRIYFTRENAAIAVATVPMAGGPTSALTGGDNASTRWLTFVKPMNSVCWTNTG